MDDFSNVEKFCGFYVSDVHLITMILPYISKKIEEKNKFITIFQNDLSPAIDKVLSKIILKEKTKKKIKDIGWEKKKILKYKDLEEFLNMHIEKNELINIVIKGNVNNVNKYIAKYLEKNKGKDNIKIINLYDVEEFNADIDKILNMHDGIINTSGEKKIEEVFEGYKKMA